MYKPCTDLSTLYKIGYWGFSWASSRERCVIGGLFGGLIGGVGPEHFTAKI